MAEKGYEFAEVTSSVEPLPARPEAGEGGVRRQGRPEGQGPHAQLQRQRRGQRRHARAADEVHEGARHAVVDHRQGHLQRSKFDEDAEKIVEYYRNKGYIAARVGQPEIKTLEDSDDKETRWVELNVPIDEGPRYRVGDFKFDGNKIIEDRVPRAALQAEGRRLVLRQADPQRPGEGARDVRRRRLLRVHRLPGPRAGRRRRRPDRRSGRCRPST